MSASDSAVETTPLCIESVPPTPRFDVNFGVVGEAGGLSSLLFVGLANCVSLAVDSDRKTLSSSDGVTNDSIGRSVQHL